MTASTPAPTLPRFDDWFARDLKGLYTAWKGTRVPQPELLILNEPLARDLGMDPAFLQSPEGIALLAGNVAPEGATPIAMAYAGHQFGHYSPRLGDGRALLLGEVKGADGRAMDVHLKGSGRTPYARRGDGKASVGPMLREYLIAEALHALHVPTTRSLAVVTTGEEILRERVEPGAVLTRIASSHVRVGTFEFAARLGDPDIVKRLTEHVIARHHPAARNAENPALELLHLVSESQASLIATWMLLGFVHGVMNTDNTTISGESIDFGPCAFMDQYDPATVFSSIDHQGRYAYGNQAPVAQWNLTRFAETLLPQIDDDSDKAVEKATAVLDAFPAAFRKAFDGGMRYKLGIAELREGDDELVVDWLKLLRAESPDYTQSYRALSAHLRGDVAPLGALLKNEEAREGWLSRWRARLDAQEGSATDIAAGMDQVNPIYIPRNHLVDAALRSATDGDMTLFHRLFDIVTHPYSERPDAEAYAQPAPAAFAECFQTFCGT